MDKELLQELRKLVEEERAKSSRQAEKGVQKKRIDLYQGNKVFNEGEMIAFRPHIGGAWCSRHRHDYVELAYVVQGAYTHIVEEKPLIIGKGELLFLSQRAYHEITAGTKGDLMINILIKQEFFEEILPIIGEEQTLLHRFLQECLCKRRCENSYLYFPVANDMFVQNLMENMVGILIWDMPNKHNLLRITIVLLLLHLMNHSQLLVSAHKKDEMVVRVLQYVEDDYCKGSLQELARMLSCDVYSLSRDIKKKIGKNYTQLVQEKRLSQACFYLRNTDMSVEEISNQIGYENVSFFYRLFRSVYGVSPRQYRQKKQVENEDAF